MTPDPIAAWLTHLHPAHGGPVGEALRALPLRAVYEDPPRTVSDPRRRLWGAEWSLRLDLRAGRLDPGRLMVPIDTERAAPGSLGPLLDHLAPQTAPGMRQLADTLHATRPDLDLLLGADLGGRVPRAKLYVLRPAGRPVAGFSELAVDLLQRAGVHPDWTAAMRDHAGQDPAFLALDLRADGRAAGKLYFAWADPACARRLLSALDRPSLVDRLDPILPALQANPTGTLVVTARGEADRTADVTLHAHLDRLPPLDPRLQGAFDALAADAHARGLRLRPSYASWLDGPTPAETLYYVIRPADRADSQGATARRPGPPGPPA